MPLFFIDTSDESEFVLDETGLDLPHLASAKQEAVRALPDLARDVLPDGDHRTFLAIVRGEDGRALLQASLTLSVTSLIPNARR